MLTYWKPILLLLKVRRQAAANDFAENPSAALGRALLALILCLAAMSRSGSLGAHWTNLTPTSAESALSRLWTETQFFWLLALLVPGIISLLGPNPQPPVLRAFPLRPSQKLCADLLASLIDTPTLIAVLSLLPLLWQLATHDLFAQAFVGLIAFTFLVFQTVCMARLIVSGSALLVRRIQRFAEIPAITALMLVGLCVGVPPAFASLTTAPSQNPKAIHVQMPSIPTIDPSPLLPSCYASGMVAAVRAGNPQHECGSMGALAALTLGTLAGAVALNRREGAVSGGRAASGRPRTSHPPDAVQIALRAGSATQLFGLAVTELRLLLRKPGAYLPLRKPAAIILLGVLGFLAPDMGRDPVYSLKELLGLGGVIYTVLWQVQLLCNRFGTENGTAAMLFSLSVPRWLLLLGKNLSLLMLLLSLDAAAFSGLLVVSEAPDNIPPFLMWMALALIVLTAIGNILSVAFPFAIARSDSESKGDAPEGLAFGYVCAGVATGLLLVPVAALNARGWPFAITAGAFIFALYCLSVWLASGQIRKHERRMIALLDRNGQ